MGSSGVPIIPHEFVIKADRCKVLGQIDQNVSRHDSFSFLQFPPHHSLLPLTPHFLWTLHSSFSRLSTLFLSLFPSLSLSLTSFGCTLSPQRVLCCVAPSRLLQPFLRARLSPRTAVRIPSPIRQLHCKHTHSQQPRFLGVVRKQAQRSVVAAVVYCSYTTHYWRQNPPKF